MLNKTPKELPAETESALKSSANNKKLVFTLLLFLVGLFAGYRVISSLFDNTIRLIAPNGFIKVEVVDTPELRTRGLSGREHLKESEGMLFVFDEVSPNHCIWMKDMNFPIDIVWLDEQKKIITVKPNVAPETYPDTFCPESNAKYVLELGAGRAETLGVVINSTVRF